MAANSLDVTGQKFGRLTAICKNGFDKSPSRVHIRWDCLCACGKLVNVRLNSLRTGAVKSCGCLKSGPSQNRTHNMSNTPIYRIWHGMKMRCIKKTHKSYYLYGGRGIKVCDRWMNSFEAFFEDMGDRPKGWSLDRINANGDYCKENCRWASNEIQTRNKRNNKFIEFNGTNLCLTDWAKRLGIGNAALMKRLKNWPIDKALTTFKE